MQKSLALTDRISRDYGEIVYVIPVLRLEWEADGEAFVVFSKELNKYIVIETSHGVPFISSKDNMLKHIEYYGSIVNKTNKGLEYLSDDN